MVLHAGWNIMHKYNNITWMRQAFFSSLDTLEKIMIKCTKYSITCWIVKMEMNQDTSRQHYVPKFYLRKFTNDNNELEVFDVATETIVKPIGPKGVAYEDYFYGIRTGEPDEISQQIEKFFQEIENLIGKKYDGLVQ